MLDRTPRHRELQTGFKMFCEKLLTREGFLVMEAGWKQKNARTPYGSCDLIIKRPAEPDTTVVDAKFYRSKRLDSSLFRNAMEELKKFRDAKKAKGAVLILTAELSDAHRAEAQKNGILVWDLGDIVQSAAKTPTLSDNLSDLLRDGDPGVLGREQFATELAILDEQSPRAKNKSEGARLIAELDQTKPGKEGARKFEQLCDKAIRYVFAEQFQRWITQIHVEDGFNRPDLIARLVPKHEYWTTLAEDFRTRYVVFSFLNDADPVVQGEILSAERHLFTGALRSVGIIVSRAGIDPGARKACHMVLRQSGKLILCLTLAELKEMLQAKDAGDEYNELLIDRTAELLTDLVP